KWTLGGAECRAFPPGQQLCKNDSLLQDLLDGNFESVLLNPIILDILKGDCAPEQKIDCFVEERIRMYLTEMVVLLFGVACLQLFVQSNWTGPPIQVHPEDFLPSSVFQQFTEVYLTAAIFNSLILDGESIYTMVSNPILLLIATAIFVACRSKFEFLQLVPCWTLRCVSIHQQLLEERSKELFVVVQSCVEKVMENNIFFTSDQFLHLAVQFLLECGHISLFYFDYTKAKEYIHRAKEMMKLQITLTGALGKRTRFQENYLPQLILNVQREGAALSQSRLTPDPTPVEKLPKDHCLTDDTVLNNIKLADPDQFIMPDLCAEEQAVVLGIW
uniref:Uncharacterized protein n=1 Tax=Erpetoichthys calabaricus TaxID=27687 RepID=A0A8C4T5Q5_ERPCA